MNRIVVKVGSNVLTRQDGTLDVTKMSSIVDQVANLRQKGYEVILVTSGAVACGRSLAGSARRNISKTGLKLDPVQQRQMYSAVGQVRLMNIYYSLFLDYGINIGQVLTMKENFSTRMEYLNQRNCMDVMLRSGVVPIVNENDTVSITELMFTDNDELSGLVATMMDADALIILSNIDGIFDGAPGDSSSKVIEKVLPGEDLSQYIKTEKSGFGRGGMITKCSIASKVAAEGIRVIIANGKRDGVLESLLGQGNDIPHTEFVPSNNVTSGVKKWIAHSSGFSKGIVTVNEQAMKALKGRKATSLLLVGVISVDGEFDEGDIISVKGPDGKEIALGRTSYSSVEAKANIGIHDIRPLVHCDYLYTI